MTTQDIVEAWRQKAIQEGVEKGEKLGVEKGEKLGVEKGEKLGVEKGEKRGVAGSLLLVYEARFGAMPDDVRGVIEDTHDVATLRGWTQLAGTRSADEVIAAIRAFRPS